MIIGLPPSANGGTKISISGLLIHCSITN